MTIEYKEIYGHEDNLERILIIPLSVDTQIV